MPVSGLDTRRPIQCIPTGAIDNSGTLDVKAKKYALMHGINARGTFFMSQAALPYLLKAEVWCVASS